MRKLAWIVPVTGILVIAGVGAAALRALRTRSTEPAIDDLAEGSPAATSARVPAPKAAANDPESTIRRHVRAAVDRAASNSDNAALAGDLDAIVAGARARGEITAMDAQVGLELIKRLGGDMETRIKFTTDLNALAEELRNKRGASAPAGGGPPRTFNEIAARLRDERDETKRQVLIHQYTDRAMALEGEERIRALSELDELVTKERAQKQQQSPPVTLAAQWATVERTRGPDQQAAIRELLEMTARLPPDERAVQMQRLNELAQSASQHAP